MGYFLTITIFLALIWAALKIYFKFKTGWCRSNTCLVGKTAIITGANTGIGYETAADFAKRGAKVILACRDPTRGKTAEKNIIKETDNPNVFFKQLDLSSFESVRRFAEEINKTEERIDILVNNAGAGSSSESTTKDGLITLMQVNHFGHFLLTNLLLDLIKRTPYSRIINVSSIAAKYAKHFDVKNLNVPPKERFVKGWAVYPRTKLCNVLFTIELAKRLTGTGVLSFSVHPGAVRTEIFRNIPSAAQFLINNSGLFKDALEGAQTTIYCSVAKGLEQFNGEHFEDCHYVRRYKTAQDPKLPSELWKESEKIVKLNK